jgi:hypothetical protein
VRSQGSLYFPEGLLIMRIYQAMALSAVALGVLLSGGCSTATTNDENVAAGAPKDAGTIPSAKDYGESITRQREKQAQAKKDAKGNADSNTQPKKDAKGNAESSAQPNPK